MVEYATRNKGKWGWNYGFQDIGSAPFIDVMRNVIHIVYEKNGEIWWTMKSGTNDWDTPQRMSCGIDCHSPQILDGIVCVWYEWNKSGPQQQIYYRVHNLFGGWYAWSAPKNLSNPSIDSRFPQIAVKSISNILPIYNLYCAWTEGNEAPYEIEYKTICLIAFLPPTLKLPAMGDTLRTVTPAFAWEDVGADSYNLVYSVDSSFTTYSQITGLKTYNYTLENDTLYNDTKIYWQVKPFKDTLATISDRYSFYWDLPKTYFVAKNGKDTNPGTRASPWLTITKSANTLKPGERVFVLRGTYNEQVSPKNSGKADSIIIYQAYPGDTVKIGGTKMYGFYLSSKSYIAMDGFWIENCYGPAVRMLNKSNSNQIRHCTMRPNITGVVSIEGMSSYLAQNNEIYENTLYLPAYGGGYGVKLYYAPATKVRDNIVQGVVKGYENGMSITFHSDSSIIANNKISNCWYGIYSYWSNGVEVSQNSITGNRCNGINVWGANGMKIHNNYIAGAGLWIGTMTNTDIYNNKIDSTKIGILLDNDCNAIKIYNNMISRAKCGIKTLRGTDYEVYFNSVMGDTCYTGTNYSSNVKLKDNIFSATLGYCIRVDFSAAPPTEFVSDYNDLYGSKIGYWGKIAKLSFADWQATGNDANSISADPMFVSTTDLHIAAASPCIDKGIEIAALTTDIDGNVRSIPPDIGGDEWFEVIGGGGGACGGGDSGSGIKMWQNYPNPFVHATTIRYQLPVKAKVSLRIYDISGRMVKELVNAEQ
ncbi:MAG: right-handed parallel beta-helix repeat-containing protein, partial [Candidatus Stahlbacteria bacterium]|nr:right-handed parallel beta-helix repeat-containing protein [Candidatus Stahlbacteria bacterium]